jgi:hypothetical protein
MYDHFCTAFSAVSRSGNSLPHIQWKDIEHFVNATLLEKKKENAIVSSQH